MTRRIAVVAHTHWDREWYAPFETFRSRLLPAMDSLLDLLESDPSFVHFHLDGQMALVDDFLDVRPEERQRLGRLVTESRLTIGPWYVLMDEFCVSGETIVRNLQLGLERAAQLGGSPRVGYLPDMFGHISQMPQLLRLAGLPHAVVWRGVPRRVNRTAFWWESPDGSKVRAEYLPVGYANGAFLPKDPDELLTRVDAHVRETARFRAAAEEPVLLMNGGDHHSPQAWLPDLLARANAAQRSFAFEHVALEDYLDSAPSEGLETIRGELRSGARANLLMGVVSNRVDLKIAAASAETALERVAEPLAALWLPADLWPRPLIDEAWLALIRNSAHDSICGCSADEVVRAVVHRYDQASALCAEVTEQALAIAAVATGAPAGTPVMVNPGSEQRCATVELVLPGNAPPEGTQLLTSTPAGTELRSGHGRDLSQILGGLARDGWIRSPSTCVQASASEGPEGIVVTFVEDAARAAEPAVASRIAEVWAQAGAARDRPMNVRVERAASQRVLTRSGPVPGFGWSVWRPRPLESPPVAAGDTWLDNGVARVEVDPSSGTFSLDGHAGLDRLVDGGDDGDTYNYSPPPRDSLVDRPECVEVSVLESGPVRGTLEVRRTFRWPSHTASGERRGDRAVQVVSRLDLHSGERLVRVTTTFFNYCRDHRLRSHFPLPRRAKESVAECAFATVLRREPEGGPHEKALATFPSRRFVSAGGLTLVHAGLLEYELVEGGSALALTLLRSIGTLSKPAPEYRPNAAGPALPVPGAQLPGPYEAHYAVAIGEDDPWSLAATAWTPLCVVASLGGGSALPDSGSRLRVEGAKVSALHRVAGELELRVFNPAPDATTVAVAGHSGRVVDLTGTEIARWSETLTLRPWEIATLRLDKRTLD